jgi:hypothetical protein
MKCGASKSVSKSNLQGKSSHSEYFQALVKARTLMSPDQLPARGLESDGSKIAKANDVSSSLNIPRPRSGDPKPQSLKNGAGKPEGRSSATSSMRQSMNAAAFLKFERISIMIEASRHMRISGLFNSNR